MEHLVKDCLPDTVLLWCDVCLIPSWAGFLRPWTTTGCALSAHTWPCLVLFPLTQVSSKRFYWNQNLNQIQLIH